MTCITTSIKRYLSISQSLAEPMSAPGHRLVNACTCPTTAVPVGICLSTTDSATTSTTMSIAALDSAVQGYNCRLFSGCAQTFTLYPLRNSVNQLTTDYEGWRESTINCGPDADGRLGEQRPSNCRWISEYLYRHSNLPWNIGYARQCNIWFNYRTLCN